MYITDPVFHLCPKKGMRTAITQVFLLEKKSAAAMNGGWLFCSVITRSSQFNFPLAILEVLVETMYAIPAIKCIDFSHNTFDADSVCHFPPTVGFYLRTVSEVRYKTALLWITKNADRPKIGHSQSVPCWFCIMDWSCFESGVNPLSCLGISGCNFAIKQRAIQSPVRLCIDGLVSYMCV